MNRAIFFVTKCLLYPIWKSFDKKSHNPKFHQLKLIKKIRKTYLATETYKNLPELNTYLDFKTSIPLSSYDDIANKLEADYRDNTQTIVPHKIESWEKTSGSTQKNKLIPYTKDFKKMIQTGFLAWAADLLLHGPKFTTGVNFLSLSPSSAKLNETAYQDDSDYLPKFIKLFFGDKFILPKNLNKITDTKNFFMVLLLHLMERKDLETFFIWSPTYLISLMQQFEQDFDEILAYADEGEIQVEGQYYSFNFSTERIIEIRQHRHQLAKIWPNLKLISMWTDGFASKFVSQIEDIFPEIPIQGKGLIATEGISTIPWIMSKGQLPLTQHIFYEFQASDGTIKPIWEIEDGHTYELIISHLSGLLRYRTNDLIKVEGKYNKTPLFHFVGRANRLIDMTGEKMSEEMVDAIFEKLNSHTSFMVPIESNPPYYLCVTNELNEEQLENNMKEFVHYKESRKLGQLNSIRVHHTNKPIKIYKQLLMNKGMTFGDIKFSSLITKPVAQEELSQLGIKTRPLQRDKTT